MLTHRVKEALLDLLGVAVGLYMLADRIEGDPAARAG